MEENLIEEWKAIPDYNERYFASTLGRIKNSKGKILKPQVGTGGYLYVAISKEPNKFKLCRLHRVIASTFIPNPNNLPQINHIDEDKLNNQVSNLEWCTNSYNMNYGSRAQKFYESNKNCKTLSKPVCQYNLEGDLIKIFPSAAEAARSIKTTTDIKIIKSRICNCCREIYKKGNSAYGFIWRYKTFGFPNKIQVTTKGVAISQYNLDGTFVKTWNKMSDAITFLGISKTAISNLTRSAKSNGKTSAYGYIWKYLN